MRRFCFGFIALATAMLVSTSAFAQTATTGGMQGVVKDQNGTPLAGVTVVATSTATQTANSEITDESGRYEITNLPPGTYDVMFYYSDLTSKRSGMIVSLGKVTPVFAQINTDAAGGEVIEIEGSAPTIDVGSTKQGVSIDQDYTKNIPVPGRTFASALGAAPGSQGDLYGVSFSGSSSLENSYIVDGVNTTGLNFGNVGSALVNEFIQETEIITGGYNAEFGRSTGGVVNVVTKSGTNEFAGSVFWYGTTEAFTSDAIRPEFAGTSIEADVNLAYDTDFGFELGGPIVKDKVWFYVGFAPRLVRNNIDKITQRRIDCLQVDPDTGEYRRTAEGNLDCRPALESTGGYADQQPDIDLVTGFPLYEELDRRRVTSEGQTYQFVSKINFALSPEHQGQLSVTGTPGSSSSSGIRGDAATTQIDRNFLTTDMSAKWTSKFNDNKTEVEGVIGWHRDKYTNSSRVDGAEDIPLQILYFGDIATWGRAFNNESERTIAGCTDGTSDDDYPWIDNCPDDLDGGYTVGGIGSVANDTEERLSGRVSASQRIKAAGQHVFKGGLDIENNTAERPRHLSGGAYYRVFLPNGYGLNYIEENRYAVLDRVSGTDKCFDSNRPGEEIGCQFFDGANPATGETLNWSGFIQDSWSIRPNLTVNAGLRYEEQRLRYSKELRNTIDPITEKPLGKNALVMNNMWAPRLGAIYDWTKEGRSKVYGHWGRFYESIPMRINERSFGGETFQTKLFAYEQCRLDADKGALVDTLCDVDPNTMESNRDQPGGVSNRLLGSGVIVAPGIKPQYMDEVIIGVDYELFEDLRLGVAFKNRRLGRVLEDVSTDGAQTYVIANPGEFDSDEETRLLEEIEELNPADFEDMTAFDAAKAQLESELEMFQGIRLFPKARRDYNSIEVNVNKRFSRSFFIQAAYTFQRTRGNFPGLFSPDTGQLDPNITSQFDLIELLANRDGPLPQDRPHYLKFDGYYVWDMDTAGQVTTGVRLRALSGTPQDALGNHWLYGFNEAYILPRGARGRTPFEKSADIHIGYGRQLGNGYTLEAFFDVFNVLNDQGTARTSEAYTFSSANPVVGGDYEDLVYLKAANSSNGSETPDAATRNINFGNTSARYAPRSGRIGLRLTF